MTDLFYTDRLTHHLEAHDKLVIDDLGQSLALVLVQIRLDVLNAAFDLRAGCVF